MVKPFLKWVGGKTQIINDVLATFPHEIETYHEPFVGGGSVLLAVLTSDDIKVKRVCASDNNPHLIAFYKHIQGDPQRLHALVDELFRAYDQSQSGKKEAFYYEQREHYRNLPSCIEKSALLLFLNKTCFRGLYREGPSGFNVPYGHYKKTPQWPTLEEFTQMQKLLEPVEFRARDFSEALAGVATTGDFVYADPPYAQETKTSFKEYTKNGYHQERLFKELQKVMFTMSNANVPCVTEFFKDCEILYIKARRAIHSKNPSSTTTEVLITNAK